MNYEYISLVRHILATSVLDRSEEAPMLWRMLTQTLPSCLILVFASRGHLFYEYTVAYCASGIRIYIGRMEDPGGGGEERNSSAMDSLGIR